MNDVLRASIQDRLWHEMRDDFVRYAPAFDVKALLMCCACGRLLPREQFSLEHLIPQQALSDDPAIVRNDPSTPKNLRSGNLLLCSAPLKVKNKVVYPLGCNSWKGKHYDGLIRQMSNTSAFQGKGISQQYVIAGLCLSYLAMVAEFGYRVVLMQSGLLMRHQFFNPTRFCRGIPPMSQVLLGSGQRILARDAPIWSRPFTFKIEPGKCFVGMRNFVVIAPLSEDPTRPIVKCLRFAPARFKLRPDFTAVFD